MKQRKIKIRPIDEVAYQNLSGEPEILRRLYASRGIADLGDLDYSFSKLPQPNKLNQIQKAATALADAIDTQQKIVIVGDFDADGATSTALAVLALRAFGAEQIHYLVPNRFEFGYGLSEGIVELAYEKYQPHWIITVDNGIANHAGVLKAAELGIRVIITDHHLPSEKLPAAEIIVNPNVPACDFPSKALAGVGVIYYVMLALRRELENRDWFYKSACPKPNMAEFLDLVAVGTVADLVPLDRTNRILVSRGLARMRAGRVRPGIKALIDIANRELATLSARDIGFAIGPRLNAAGRLEDMSIGIACLLAGNASDANRFAQTLNELNEQRKLIESEIKSAALIEIDSLFDLNTLPHGICLYDPAWHQGVIGIVAGRIKEFYLRPTIIFAADTDTVLKGSARSVPGVHIRDILAEIDAKYEGLILKFGGHAMAAGLSIESKHFKRFADIFNQCLIEKLTVDELEGVCFTDGALAPEALSLETYYLLQSAEPWGQQFPLPLFCNEFKIQFIRSVGKGHLKLEFYISNLEKTVQGIWFNPDRDLHDFSINQTVRVLYELSENRYQGLTRLQLMIHSIQTF